ncbi:FG-GAP repeat domain-containing protein [Paenibacillus thalictri]|uniref:VCBS repeat-containing protein n=1 Tax=Paenibacillus thalictri TaxID=2527873 RepID=A0A4Q9DUB3_9BACL|nr:VCBS repeat-containing protein [Paenibacillus thalictri]TBL80567.1 VCBS repeat-containing protein [Paenibacillus thalictri]
MRIPPIVQKSAAIGSVAVLCLCSACGIIQSPESYMRLPKLPAEQEALKTTIEQSLPAGAVLVRPKTPNRYGTIPVLDLDGDGVKEAVAFYKEQTSSHIIGEVWKQKPDGGWQMAARLPEEGSSLEELSFQDLTNDGQIDIAVGTSLSNAQPKGLSVYGWDGTNWTAKMKLTYSNWAVGDLNGDGKKDISVETEKRNGGLTSSSFTLMQYDGQPVTLGTIELASGINAVYSMKLGNVAAGRQGVVLDMSVGAHSSQTQLVVFDQDELKTPLPVERTFKAYSGLSEDADGDGIIEISGMKQPPGWEQEPMYKIPWIMTYARWDGDKGLIPVMERYNNLGLGYYFNIPKDWGDGYTVEIDGEHIVRFVSYPDRKQLAAIRMFSLEEWAQETSDAMQQTPQGSQTQENVQEALQGSASSLSSRESQLSEMSPPQSSLAASPPVLAASSSQSQSAEGTPPAPAAGSAQPDSWQELARTSQIVYAIDREHAELRTQFHLTTETKGEDDHG